MPRPATNLYPQTSGLYPGDGVGEVAPEAVTGAATPTAASALLEGTVDPNGLTAHYYFEYGTSDGYGSQSPTFSAGTGTSPVSVSATIGGLRSGRLYHYRLVAFNPIGFAYGADATFATEFGPHDPHPHRHHEAGRGQ